LYALECRDANKKDNDKIADEKTSLRKEMKNVFVQSTVTRGLGRSKVRRRIDDVTRMESSGQSLGVTMRLDEQGNGVACQRICSEW